MLNVGMFIQNRYEIIARIGSGGMADVYKAKDHKLNRFVAVKVLKKEFRTDKVFIAKFRAEAQSAAGLAHANIVNIYDVGEEAGISYIVMELVEGITLKEYIKNKGRLSVREATSIALQISAGLEAAHNNGIIHRDVKPQNIIISMDGKVKVADFGIARATTTNTINSGVMGSVHYSSPEQSRGGYSDEKSDIYSLGITMYEMLVGHVPFDGDTAVAIAIRHLQEELHSPRELVPEIPYSTNQIVMKCTNKSPDRRYANMTELIRDLRESLVNPEGDFVNLQELDRTSQTIIMSKDEVQQINAEQNRMPAYDESMDVGAAAGLHSGESEPKQNRAYQPGSYYQKSQYQEVSPGRAETYEDHIWNDTDENSREYDPYYDKYDNPRDYAIHDEKPGGDYRIKEGFAGKRTKRGREEREIGLNPKLEKAVTVGGIIVAVIIGCIFLALLANAIGLFKFESKTKKPETDPAVEETQSETETEKEEVKQVSVPSLLGKNESDVQELLESYGLKGSKQEAASSDQVNEYAPGQVCSQNPKGGEVVEHGSTVTYEIVPEDAQFELPDLSNVEQSTAQAFLLTKGLQCVIDNTKYSDAVESGHVISTDPETGSPVKAGDQVTLFVSQGAQEDIDETALVTPWDLYCYTKDQATKALEMLELQVVYEYEPSQEVAEGLVISQSAPADQPVARGTTVTLVISTGPSAAGDGNITVQNTGSGTWECDASLETPSGYSGQQVRITLSQNGTETEIFKGNAEFPYRLKVQGAAGIESGTAYVYLLDEATGEVSSKIEYPGITFSRVN